MKGKPFKIVHTAHPGRSAFDLSYIKLLTCDMGQLIPVCCEEVIPGDKWSVGNEIVIRFQPMVAPILHEINCFVHYFFVPYRLLWDDWQNFITGGPVGTDASVLPRWDVSDPDHTVIGSLWDYMGFPALINPLGAIPLDFNRRAYYLIWNEYYRDETLQAAVDITSSTYWQILNRSWEKDYFTSALPWQQRGTAPALPISGLSAAVFSNDVNLRYNDEPSAGGVVGDRLTGGPIANIHNGGTSAVTGGKLSLDSADLSANIVDLSGATTFDVADLRLVFQIQKWLERNARCGVRYTEFLHAHFGVSPRDDRLQRPEYIGGSKSPVIVSEVLQTSSTDGTSPQGNMAGHGITASTQFCGKYFANEFGLIMGIMSIVPKPMYQQGINRQWLRRTKYDFYFPEFANLSEQAIEQAEIYADGVEAHNTAIFGYQGRYDEMRYKPNMVCGLMKTDFDFWHLGRIFGSAPALNASFLECIPDKRIFAVENQPDLIVSFGNLLKAIRPIPVSAEPGLIDHG
nr:MAG: major capsid protein [Microviridae sp.]